MNEEIQMNEEIEILEKFEISELEERVEFSTCSSDIPDCEFNPHCKVF